MSRRPKPPPPRVRCMRDVGVLDAERLRDEPARRPRGSASAPRSRACRRCEVRGAVLRLERRVRDERVVVLGANDLRRARERRVRRRRPCAASAAAPSSPARRRSRRSRGCSTATPSGALVPLDLQLLARRAWRATSCRRRWRHRRAGRRATCRRLRRRTRAHAGLPLDLVEVRALHLAAEHRDFLDRRRTASRAA